MCTHHTVLCNTSICTEILMYLVLYKHKTFNDAYNLSQSPVYTHTKKKPKQLKSLKAAKPMSSAALYKLNVPKS